MALFVGGLCQLLAGMWEFAAGNTLGATGEFLDRDQLLLCGRKRASQQGVPDVELRQRAKCRDHFGVPIVAPFLGCIGLSSLMTAPL